MEPFEFFMVLVSIIIGLGLTELLTGVARLLRSRARVRVYWLHLLGVVAVFLALLQQWWETWGMRAVPEWSFVALLFMLTAPICLFLIAHLLFPETVAGADLEVYYYGEMRPIWALAAIAVVASTSFGSLVFGDPLFLARNATSLVLFLAFLALLWVRRRRFHAIVIPALVALLILDIFLWSGSISS